MSSSEEKQESAVIYIDEPPLNKYIESFFNNYSSIPRTELRNHLIKVRENAWNQYPYPCLGRWGFLEFSIRQNPIYNEIVDKCKNEGATVIDFGCCLGQDIRQLIFDGVPIKQIRGYELDHFFLEQGYQLFKDEQTMKDNHVFQSADIFDDQLLEKIQAADYLYVGSFIHLFNAQTQKEVCRRLIRLSKNAIFGRQVGSLIAKEYPRPPGTGSENMMCHSPESFQQMWNEVTNGQWIVEYFNFNKVDTNQKDFTRQLFTFVVRKKT